MDKVLYHPEESPCHEAEGDSSVQNVSVCIAVVDRSLRNLGYWAECGEIIERNSMIS
jgi:hypothetical protein